MILLQYFMSKSVFLQIIIFQNKDSDKP